MDEWGYNDVDWGAYDYGEYIPLGDPYDSTWDPYISSNGIDYVPPSYLDPYMSSQSVDVGYPQGMPQQQYNPGGAYVYPSQTITNESIARSVPAPGTGSWANMDSGQGGYIQAPGGMDPAASHPFYANALQGLNPAGYRITDWSTMDPALQHLQYRQQTPQSRPAGGGSSPQQYSGRTQMPQINLGGPGGPVWDRLQAVMADPTKMTTDPAFSFLYNQGLQALNRSLAAQRLTHSGKALTDTLNYGQGAAANYFNQLIPQLRGVAGDEYQRWAGPAQMTLQAYGLGQRDTANQMQATQLNNRLLADERGEQMLSDLLPMLAGGGNTQGGMLPSSGGGIGWGGMSQMYNPVGRTLQQDWQPPQLEGGVNTGPVQQYYQPEDLAELYL